MTFLKTSVDPRNDIFRGNADAMLAAVEDLRRKVAVVRAGGAPAGGVRALLAKYGRAFPPGDWDGHPSQLICTDIKPERVLSVIRAAIVKGERD